MSKFIGRVLGYRRDGRPILEVRGGRETVDELLTRLRGELATLDTGLATAQREQLALRTQHQGTIDRLQAVVDGRPEGQRSFTAAEDTEFRAAVTGKREVDAALERLQTEHTANRAALSGRITEVEDEVRRDQAADTLRGRIGGTPQEHRGGARVGAEARTYTRDTARRDNLSFFADAFQMTFTQNPYARERIERHMKEVAVEGEGGQQAQRAASSSSFAGLIIPQYLVDEYALIIRSGRPFANAVMRLPLPEQGESFNIPRGTTGASVASQSAENTSLSSTDEVWTNLTISLATVGGQQDVSRQSLERGAPGIDQLVYNDLGAAYAGELDRQTLNGSGASGQMLGIFQTSGIYAATAFGAAVTAANFNTKMAGLVSSVAGTGVGITPRLWVMHPRRWGWLTGLSDSNGRPLVTPNTQAPFNSLAANTDPGGYGGDANANNPYNVVGIFQGLPVITDANVPTAVGTNNEDLVGLVDNQKLLLWEDGDGAPNQLRFEQTLGNQLTVKLVAYGYAAFTAGRYPQAVGKAGGLDTSAGNGLISPVF